MELIREEEKRIREEREERKEEKKKLEMEKEKEKKREREEILVDKAPVISASTTPEIPDTAVRITSEKSEEKFKDKKEEHFQSKDFEIIEEAIDTVSKEKRLLGKRQNCSNFQNILREMNSSNS